MAFGIYGNNNWEIIKPLATTNLVTNPSLETGSTGYTAHNSSVLTRVSSDQYFGAYSLEVDPTTNTTGGVYFGTVSLTSGTTYTASVYIKGVASIPYTIYFANTSGTELGTSTDFTATGDWERVEVTYTEVSSTTRRIYITKNSSSNSSPYYIDGLQVEAQSAASTYCDGDQVDCIWNSTDHASTSYRTSQTRLGGQIINLRDDLDLLVRQQPGTGMPPVRNISNDLGLQDGSEYQRTLADIRVFSLQGIIQGSSIADFHNKRQAVINAIKSDATSQNQPFLLRYNGASSGTKQIKVVYDSGLELNPVDQGVLFEPVDIRFVAYDPFWESEGDQGTTLSGCYPLSACRLIRRSACGEWDSMDGGFNNDVKVAENSDGDLFAYGSFNKAGSINVWSRTASWTGTVWQGQGTGSTNGNVNAIVFRADNSMYAFGAFTTINGVTANRAASWTGTTWQATASTNGCILGATVGSNNGIYVGGDFTSPTQRAACYNPTTSSYLGLPVDAGCPNNIVRALQFDKNGILWLGGDFIQSNASNILYFNASGYNSPGGLNGRVYSIAVADDNTIYMSGCMTAVNVESSSTVACAIAQYNGTKLSDVGGGVQSAKAGGTTQRIEGLSFYNGNLYLAGTFLLGGQQVESEGIAFWNGTTYLPIPVDIGFSNMRGVQALVRKNKEIIFTYDNDIGTTGGGTFNVTASATISVNGAKDTKPQLVLTGSGTLVEVVNYTTSQIINFQGLTISQGETVKIDFEQRTVISNTRGNLIRYIVPGSNFSNWRLLGGANNIGLFVKDSAITARLYWKNRHWSIDG